MKLRVFTDGACSKNGQAGASAAWACWFPENTLLSKSDHVPSDQLQTNQRAELLAISKAVQIVENEFDPVEIELQIYTDSVYCKNCLTAWLPGWIQKNWKNSQGAPVAHRDLIEDTSNRLSRFKSYIITYVPAHTGKDDDFSRNNDIVDKMAVKVLQPDLNDKEVITSNKATVMADFPLQLMGPPVSEKEITEWCMKNIHKLDDSALKSALISALCKTAKKKGFEVVKQRLHRSTLYRLKTDNSLIREKPSIVKEE
jgi:ribonuclease HI